MGHAARLVVLIALAGTARADDPAPRAGADDRAPRAGAGHPDVEVRSALELGLHAPRSLAVDVWVALNERLVLGLTTSHAARHELGAGRGLCLARCGDRLPDVLPADDPYRFAGVAAEARLAFAPGATGRVAIDTTRFAPTPAALELGLDFAKHLEAFDVLVAPVIRIGLVRRDLDDNRDAGSVEIEARRRTWCTGGLRAIVRGEVALQALRSTPSLGAAVGAWTELGAVSLAILAGTSEVERASARSSLFAEIAVAWRR